MYNLSTGGAPTQVVNTRMVLLTLIHIHVPGV